MRPHISWRSSATAAFLSSSLLIAAFSPIRAHAHVPVGSLNGIVTDPKGAVITSAHITAVSAAQGISRDTVTDNSGLYSLADLPTGAYDLRVEHTGFATAEFKSVILEAGLSRTIDARLTIAATPTTVQVNASNAAVDLTQSMIQGQITSQHHREHSPQRPQLPRTRLSHPWQSARAHLRPHQDQYPRSQLRRRIRPRRQHHRRRRRQQRRSRRRHARQLSRRFSPGISDRHRPLYRRSRPLRQQHRQHRHQVRHQ